jgi:hypothetical protein
MRGQTRRRFILLLALIGSTLVPSFPSQASGTASDTATVNKVRILVMRHGERPGDSTVPDLTEAGHRRAKELARFLCERFGKPDFIIAAALYNKNNRPQLTVKPLSELTGVPIDDSLESIKNKELADRLLHDGKYDGKLVVVNWHHSQIPLLARELHAPKGSFPDPWDNSIYNLILEFDFTGRDVPDVKQVVEPF